MHIFRDRGVYIDVYKGDDNFATSGAMLLSGLDLQKTYRAIDSVATGRIPPLFCAKTLRHKTEYVSLYDSDVIIRM